MLLFFPWTVLGLFRRAVVKKLGHCTGTLTAETVVGLVEQADQRVVGLPALDGLLLRALLRVRADQIAHLPEHRRAARRHVRATQPAVFRFEPLVLDLDDFAVGQHGVVLGRIVDLHRALTCAQAERE